MAVFLTDQLQCWIELEEAWQWQLYMSLVSVALFIIPAIIISACYAVIVTTIWANSKMLTTRHSFSEDDTRRVSSRGLIPRAKIKTVKMTIVIVFGEFST